jgi:hypothetical protein
VVIASGLDPGVLIRDRHGSNRDGPTSSLVRGVGFGPTSPPG